MKEDAKIFACSLEYANKMHMSQTRKDGTPYILHPIKVSMILAKKGFDVRYQIVGLFHDLLEDTTATEEQLREFCDDEMIGAIKLLTKVAGQSEAEYINNIILNSMAKEVKNADRIDNLTDLQESSNQRFKERYLYETKEFFVGKFSKELDDLYYKIVNDGE